MEFFKLTIIFGLCFLIQSFTQPNKITNQERVGEGLVAINRLLMLKEWSIKKAKEHYPGQMEGGEKGDAYRHVLASVLSRRYFGKTVASSSGFVNELLRDVNGTNTPRDRFMDLHNNRVGRVACYKELVGKSANETAKNVLHFFNTQGNFVLTNWGGTMPTKKEARKVAKDKSYSRKIILY